MFGNKLIAGTNSKCGNKYAEVLATKLGWMCALPMKRKSESHEALSLMFHRDDVPPSMAVDVLKEQVEGDFSRKCKEDGCYLKQTDPYSP